jgi:heptaprenyl diphosphate synthase
VTILTPDGPPPVTTSFPPLSSEPADTAFLSWAGETLAEIEEQILATAEADSTLVTEMAQHIPSAGGKRFRPLLVVGAAGLGFDAGSPPDDVAVVRAAVTVELTHVASLYHDDVMDEADVRRGRPSANKQYDNRLSIMAGDFLFARASSAGALLGIDYVSYQAGTFARLVQGQIAELTGPAAGVDPVEHHLAVLADKTASLIATSARFGGMAAGLPSEQLEALTRFGERVGVAFQLADDLIDITSDVTGKPSGADLREGVLTLAPLLVLRQARAEDARLRELLAAPVAPADLPEALDLMRRHPVIDEVREEIERRAQEALAEIAPLPDGPAKQCLEYLAQAAVRRRS